MEWQGELRQSYGLACCGLFVQNVIVVNLFPPQFANLVSSTLHSTQHQTMTQLVATHELQNPPIPTLWFDLVC